MGYLSLALQMTGLNLVSSRYKATEIRRVHCSIAVAAKKARNVTHVFLGRYLSHCAYFGSNLLATLLSQETHLFRARYQNTVNKCLVNA